MRRFLILMMFLPILNSCCLTQHSKSLDITSSYFSFTKVKLKIKSTSFGSIELRGFIRSVKDTVFCFKFFGPLSMEVLRGRIDTSFIAYDSYHKQLYENLFEVCANEYHLNLNLELIQNLLFGRIYNFEQEFARSNPEWSFFNFDTSPKGSFKYINSTKGLEFSVNCSSTKGIPKELALIFKSDYGITTFKFTFISVTNEKTGCNFKF